MEALEKMQTELEHKPTVSVIIPSFNRANILPRAIASVLAQTFSNFELIIVDDGSTDNTAEVVKEFTDERIRYIPLGKNCGGNYARNQGIKAARAEYVSFLDSDDEWLPKKLELQMSYFKDKNAFNITVIYSQYYEYQELTKRQVLVSSLYEEDMLEQLLKGWCPILSTFIIKSSALLSIGGFDESLPSFQDYDLFLRLAKVGNRFAAVSEPLVKKYVHQSNQITGNLNVRLKGFQIFQNRWGAAMKSHLGFWGYRRWVSENLSFVYLRQVQKAVNEGNRWKAWQYLFEMFQFLPWARKSMFKGLVFALVGQNIYKIISQAKNASSDIKEQES